MVLREDKKAEGETRVWLSGFLFSGSLYCLGEHIRDGVAMAGHCPRVPLGFLQLPESAALEPQGKMSWIWVQK